MTDTQRGHIAYLKGGPKHGEILYLDDLAWQTPRTHIHFMKIQSPRYVQDLADSGSDIELATKTVDYEIVGRELPLIADAYAHHWRYEYIGDSND